MLRLPRHRIVRQSAQVILRLAPAAHVGRVVQVRRGARLGARADVHVALVGGIPVRGDGGLVRERQVGFALVDEVGFGGAGCLVKWGWDGGGWEGSLRHGECVDDLRLVWDCFQICYFCLVLFN